MRAAVLHGKGDVRIERVEVPRLEPGDVLLRTRAALTCGTDAKVFQRGYHARMIKPPALFGHEVAGIVEAVGPGPHGIEPGAPVVAANSAPCGDCEFCRRGRESLCDDLLFWNGAYAELVRIPSRVARRNLIRIPDGVSFPAAALTEPLACVTRGVDESRIVPGQTVAVIGVGPIGLMLIALARRRGARVVAAGRRAEALERARELGADALVAVDAGDDLAELLRRESPDGRGPHVVVEAAGTAETAEAAVRAVRKGGLVNLFAGCPADARIEIDVSRLHYEEVTVTSSFHHTPSSLREAFRLIAEGKVPAATLISGEAPLEELPDILQQMSESGGALKVAIIP
jgi:L-iditol 2-dehydrogenase